MEVMTAIDDFRSWVALEHPEVSDAINSVPLATLLTLYPDVTPQGERYDRVKAAAHAIRTRGRRTNTARSTSMKKFNNWIDFNGDYANRSVQNQVSDSPTTVEELVWNTLAKEPYWLPMKQFNAKISNNFFYGAFYYVTQDWGINYRGLNSKHLRGFRLVSGIHGVNIQRGS